MSAKRSKNLGPPPKQTAKVEPTKVKELRKVVLGAPYEVVSAPNVRIVNLSAPNRA